MSKHQKQPTRPAPRLFGQRQPPQKTRSVGIVQSKKTNLDVFNLFAFIKEIKRSLRKCDNGTGQRKCLTVDFPQRREQHEGKSTVCSLYRYRTCEEIFSSFTKENRAVR